VSVLYSFLSYVKIRTVIDIEFKVRVFTTTRQGCSLLPDAV